MWWPRRLAATTSILARSARRLRQPLDDRSGVVRIAVVGALGRGDEQPLAHAAVLE
jgi:hypothetical protein